MYIEQRKTFLSRSRWATRFLNRRNLLKKAAYGVAGLTLGSSAEGRPSPIIDAHIHLFDTARPGGVPWPENSDAVLYQPALPGRYRTVTKGLGIVGAIAIEASPLATDNDWLLRVAGENPIIVGVVGDLVPSDPAYPGDLERLHTNPLFLGLRYGNLWNRNLLLDLQKAYFLDGLKLLAQAGLVFESANPDTDLIHALVNISEHVPDLRIVVDHLPHASVPAEKTANEEYWSELRTLSQNPRVFVKLSEIPVRVHGKLVIEPGNYKGSLDALWNIFGEDRVLFGSDWPNSDHIATYAQTFRIVREYISGKSTAAAEKFFWKNSFAAYRWRPRSANQTLPG